MKPPRQAVLAVALLCACSAQKPIEEPQWHLLGQTGDDGQSYYVDRNSIESRDGLHRIWWQLGDGQRSKREQLAFDCDARTYSDVQNLSDELKMKPIDPGSILPVMFNAVCFDKWPRVAPADEAIVDVVNPPAEPADGTTSDLTDTDGSLR